MPGADAGKRGAEPVGDVFEHAGGTREGGWGCVNEPCAGNAHASPILVSILERGELLEARSHKLKNRLWRFSLAIVGAELLTMI